MKVRGSVPSFEFEVDVSALEAKISESASGVLAGVEALRVEVELLNAEILELIGGPPLAPPRIWDGMRGVRGQCSSVATTLRTEATLDALEEVGATDWYVPNWWQESYFPPSESVRGFDSLGYAVEAAHERGIRVHALFVCAYTFNLEGWDAGVTLGIPEAWLDFTSAGAREHLADVVQETVELYQVDGVLYDYIRWAGRWAGDYGLGCEPVTEAVAGMTARVRACDPTLPIGCSPFADFRYARESCGQDAGLWLNEGLVDYATPMAYPPEGKNYIPYWITRWNETGQWPGRILPRVSSHWLDTDAMKPVSRIVAEIAEFLEAGAVGMTLWDDIRVRENAELQRALAEGGW